MKKDFEVTYPEDYGFRQLAGKTVKFHAVLGGICGARTCPRVFDDEFAQELGDLPYGR